MIVLSNWLYLGYAIRSSIAYTEGKSTDVAFEK